MAVPSSSPALQKPSFDSVETGLKFLPVQAVTAAGFSSAPTYHEWPRLQVPRNISQFSFEHRASFHGRG